MLVQVQGDSPSFQCSIVETHISDSGLLHILILQEPGDSPPAAGGVLRAGCGGHFPRVVLITLVFGELNKHLRGGQKKHGSHQCLQT